MNCAVHVPENAVRFEFARSLLSASNCWLVRYDYVYIVCRGFNNSTCGSAGMQCRSGRSERAIERAIARAHIVPVANLHRRRLATDTPPAACVSGARAPRRSTLPLRRLQYPPIAPQSLQSPLRLLSNRRATRSPSSACASRRSRLRVAPSTLYIQVRALGLGLLK